MSEVSSVRIAFSSLGEGGPYQVLSECRPIVLGMLGQISIQCAIDGGADGVAPIDAPEGVFEVYCAADESAPPIRFLRPAIGETPLSALAAAGDNALVNIVVQLEQLPGARAWIRYARVNGGGAARARVWVTPR